MSKNLTIAITGASGIQYGVKLLELLKNETSLNKHLIVSASGWITMQYETAYTKDYVYELATASYSPKAINSCLASGSHPCQGMIIAPCSMRTLAAIANGFSDNLITRAADVTLKERRKLVLLVRETPLNLAHIRNMEKVTEMGGIIFPPLPAFYQQPNSIEDVITDTAKHALELVGLHEIANRKIWDGGD